ncbi:ferritin-like domain-containing protein [Thalassobacillus pellis]|uniref:ferritin-like domain-containing protein n=1 Tax=Thalassobacillus pellis TaxID=748008 RepID=UPI00195FE138|nr:ferritin-like domain-containing protein [Thalassobacillus pellis]MBM7554241.1 bacterioferritin [Thalassobacillus pellis]
MSDIAIKELNAFLKGQYMGIHAYEHLIQRIEDPKIKQELQNIQQEHKMHAMEVAERIQHLGGTPVDDEGITGSMQNFFSRFTLPDSPQGMLEKAYKGEDVYGIQLSEEIVKGDLDPTSKQLIERILQEDQHHLETLNQLMKTT